MPVAAGPGAYPGAAPGANSHHSNTRPFQEPSARAPAADARLSLFCLARGRDSAGRREDVAHAHRKRDVRAARRRGREWRAATSPLHFRRRAINSGSGARAHRRRRSAAYFSTRPETIPATISNLKARSNKDEIAGANRLRFGSGTATERGVRERTFANARLSERAYVNHPASNFVRDVFARWRYLFTLRLFYLAER